MKTKNDTLNAIQTMVDSAVNKAGYDKTRNAVVIARNSNNTYNIKMDGIEYDNVVFYGSGEAQVNEVVKVAIPNNQASQMYVMGKGGVIASDSNPIGSVIAFAGSNAPVGYLMCDGSAVSRETYADLFAVIGTTYGVGDGSTTFNLPDAQGRTLVGVDSDDADFDLADTGGRKGAWYHSHTYSRYLAATSGQWGAAGTKYKDAYQTVSTSLAGDSNNQLSADKANMPPYLSLNYIIKATHSVTIQGVDTMSEAEYQDLMERLV